MILPRVSGYGKHRTPSRKLLVPVPTLGDKTEFLVSNLRFFSFSPPKKSRRTSAVAGNVYLIAP